MKNINDGEKNKTQRFLPAVEMTNDAGISKK